MTTVAEHLHKWAVQELCLVSEGGVSKVPDAESLRQFTKGRNKKLWTYVVNHVRSQSTAQKVKRTLMLKRLLKEREESNTFYDDHSSDVEKLKAAISIASEKRDYLMRSLSTIEERTLVLEQRISQIKNEKYHLHQKTALLEQLKQLYDKKNAIIKELLKQISSYQRLFREYQSAKAHGNLAAPVTYDFRHESSFTYNETASKMKHIVEIGSSIIEGKFFEDEVDIGTLKQNYHSSYREFTKSGILLTDFIIHFKEMSSADLQQLRAVNMQNSSLKEYILNKSKQHPVNTLLHNRKCESIYYAISTEKSKQEIGKIFITKEQYLDDKVKKVWTISNDVDIEEKQALLKILAENEALSISVHYLENNLKEITEKTNLVLENVHRKKLCEDDIESVIQHFHKKVDLTLYLFYSTPDAMKEICNVLSSLQIFAQSELFDLPFPPLKECIEKLRRNFSLDKTLTWDYCDKTQSKKPFFTEPLSIDPLPTDVRKFFKLEPYQNISVLCEKWMLLKQKLRAKIAADSKVTERSDSVNVSLSYSNILKFLEKMKFSVEKGMLLASEGITGCHKVDERIKVWWDQNAQFIPQIEYEGKTLKVWLDILLSLSDFEPNSLPN